MRASVSWPGSLEPTWRDWLVDSWIGSYLMLDTGEGSVTSHTIEHLTGRRPMTLSEFLAAEPSSFAI